MKGNTVTTPSRRDRFRPLELLSLSAVFGVFTGVVVLMSSREWAVAGISAGIAFIVTILVLSILMLATTPDAEERRDIDGQDHRAAH